MARLNVSGSVGAGVVGLAGAIAQLAEDNIVATAVTPPNMVTRNLGMGTKIGLGVVVPLLTIMVDQRTADSWGLEGASYGALAVGLDTAVEKAGRNLLNLQVTRTKTAGAARRRVAAAGYGRVPVRALPQPSAERIVQESGQRVLEVHI